MIDKVRLTLFPSRHYISTISKFGRKGMVCMTKVKSFKARITNKKSKEADEFPEDPEDLSTMKFDDIPEQFRNLPNDGVAESFLFDLYAERPWMKLSDMILCMPKFGIEMLKRSKLFLMD